MLSQANNKPTIHASAPGKLMLLGEHAVLHNSKAIVAAIDRRIHAFLTPRTDQEIIITSSHANHKTNIDNFTSHPKLGLACKVIQLFSSKINTGFELVIKSEFSSQLGLGSSAAVSTAVYAALSKWLNTKELNKTIALSELTEICQTSGADVAACIYGGLIAYKKNPQHVEQLNNKINIEAVYSGSKDTTENVVKHIQQATEKNPQQYNNYFKQIENIVNQAIVAINKNDNELLINCISSNQDIMQQMQLSSNNLDEIYNIIKDYDTIDSVKISGAGRGDCIWAMGKLNAIQKIDLTQKLKNIIGAEYLNLNITTQGIIYHDSKQQQYCSI